MAYEDFTTYTEVDEDADLTVTATKVDVSTMDADVTSHVHADKGAGHFGDFEHLIDARLTSYSGSGSAFMGVWAVSNTYHTDQEFADNNDGMEAYWYGSTSGNLYIQDRTNDNSDSYIGGNLPVAIRYLTIKRAGTTLTCKVYSDSARTALVDTLTLVCANTTYKFIHGLYSANYGAGGRHFTGYNEKLDLQEGGETHTPSDTAKASDALTFKAEVPIGDTAKASDSISFFKGLRFAIGDTAKASDSFGETHVDAGACDSSCATFSILGDSYSIYFAKPMWGGEQYNLRKNLQSFNFWSGNFSIHDKGINNEPIILSGVEIGDVGCGCDHDCFTAKFVNMRTMAKNNEEVEISGLGDCVDAIYVVKSFSTKTMHKKDARIWTLTLEYVRDA